MQAFIFDMDGVIIDSEKVYEQADQKWFAENGIQTDRIALRQCLGCTDDVNWGMIAKWNPDRDIPEIYRQYREFCKEIRVNYRQIYRPYVQTLIDQCHQYGIQTALASSSPMDNILTVIRDCGLENQFDFIVSTYALHHCGMADQIDWIQAMTAHLKPQGQVLIGDIAFENEEAYKLCRRQAASRWDAEESI